MADRAHVLETVQIGLEVTPGTLVTAPTNVRGMSIGMTMGGGADIFRPDGRKFPAVIAPNAEWSTWSLTGKPTYTEICYPLENIYGPPVGGVTIVGVLGRKRVYEMSDTAVAAPHTLTIEKGNSVRAQRITYGLLHDLAFSFSRAAGLSVTGAGIGQLFTDGVTMTASPVDVPLIPLMGKQLNCYIDPTAAALGTTKMLRAFSFAPSLTGAYGPIWVMDSTLGSFASAIDLAPTTSLKLRVEADASGMAYLTQYRAGTQIFVRLDATGPIFEAALPYKFQYDVSLGIKTVTTDIDETGVTVVEYDCEFVKDTTWTKAFSISTTNITAAL